MLRIVATVTPEFEWREQAHGNVLRWLLWVEDSDTEVIYHHEMWLLTRKMMQVRVCCLGNALDVALTRSCKVVGCLQVAPWAAPVMYHLLSHIGTVRKRQGGCRCVVLSTHQSLVP